MNIKNALRKIRAKFLPANAQYVWEELEAINHKLDVIDKKLDLYALQIYKKEDESNQDARIRLFRNLPEAIGVLSLYQAVNTKMLSDLIMICESNRLDYWMWSGSAIAAVARGKAIPWDDDIDICMMRDDFNALLKAMENHPVYQLSIYYSYPAKNITYRFVSRNLKIPNFIDIVVCDWATDDSPQTDRQYKALHNSLEAEFLSHPGLSYWRQINWVYSDGMIQHLPIQPNEYDQTKADKNIAVITAIYNKYFGKAYQEGLICSKEVAKAVAYGLDNMFDKPKRRDLWNREIIFPLHTIPYESIDVKVPNHAMDFCEICFPGWPYIPGDICGHSHIREEIIQNPQTIDEMERFIQ